MSALSARSAALQILLACEKDGAYSTVSLLSFLKSHPEMDARERSLLTLLVYGVLERKLTLDYNISLYLLSSLRKLHPVVRATLELGAYQIFYADRIPDRAAVNESVSLVKQNGCAFAGGLVNAVLRKLSVNGVRLPDSSEGLKYLSVKYSCPEALIRHYVKDYGLADAERILEHSIGARPVFLRVNPLKTNAEALAASLREEGLTVEFLPEPDALMLPEGGDVAGTLAFRNGLFHVQDLSSQIAARLLGAKPGETVVDCCAAPGGKTCTIAQEMKNDGTVYAFDLHDNKVGLIEENAARLGITIVKAKPLDARDVKSAAPSADRVLCDVPCSGFGVIGRKPEIKYKDLSQTSLLPELQSQILNAASSIVRPGGTLVYSTCTLSRAENDDVCDAFLASHQEFRLADDGDYAAVVTGKYMTVFPSERGDGFFAAKFVRTTI